MRESGRAAGDPDTAAGEDVDAVMANLRELLDRARHFSARMARDVHPDLEPAVFAVLVDIATAAPVRASELVAHRGVDKALVSRQVASLERLGLVGRHADPQDARASLITLTPLGKRAVSNSRKARQRFARRLFSDLTADERHEVAQALALLNRLLRALR